MDYSTPGFPSFTVSWSLPRLVSTEVVKLSNHLILCHRLLLFALSLFHHQGLFRWASSLHQVVPGTGEPRGLPSMGSHRVGHDWSDLAYMGKKKSRVKWAATWGCCSLAQLCLTICDRMDTRLPRPSLFPEVCTNSCPLSWWCYLTISSSAMLLHDIPSII